MPEVPGFVLRYLEIIDPPGGVDRKLDIFDPEEYREEELGWVHVAVGYLLGYFLHKAMIVPPSAGSLVFDSEKGFIRAGETPFHAPYQITKSLLLGWSDSHLLAFFIPDDGEWHVLIKVIWEEGLLSEELGLKELMVCQVVDNLDELAPEGNSWLEQITFPVGGYPWFDKTMTPGCGVLGLADSIIAKSMFQNDRRTGGELVCHGEALALVDVSNRRAAVKLWGRDEFSWDSTAP